MKTVMLATEVGSTFTYKENYMGRAVYSTLDKGQYAINAKVKLTNRQTGEVVKLGSTTPIKAKELFEYQMLMPRERLEQTLPGMVGSFFNKRHNEKNQWVISLK